MKSHIPTVFSNDDQEFDRAYRRARILAASNLIPVEFRGEENVPNTVIALDIANRLGFLPMMVLQNIDVIHGRPGFRGSFVAAIINSSGLFERMRYKVTGEPGTDDWGCAAWTREVGSEDVLEGPRVTIGLAKGEGWYDKKGSKWKTLPELMMRYRAVSFWGRLYAPELLMGLQTTEELVDIAGDYEVVQSRTPTQRTEVAAALEEAAKALPAESKPSPNEEQEKALAELQAKAAATLEEAAKALPDESTEFTEEMLSTISEMNKNSELPRVELPLVGGPTREEIEQKIGRAMNLDDLYEAADLVNGANLPDNDNQALLQQFKDRQDVLNAGG